jgi:hypothetical protein
VQCLAVHHVEELGLTAFRSDIERMAAQADGVLVRDLERAAGRLASVAEGTA